MSPEIGEIYFERGKTRAYALIVKCLEGKDRLVAGIITDTDEDDSSARDRQTEFPFRTSDFLRDYERATLQNSASLIASLEQRQNRVTQKINLLEQAAQNQSSHESERMTGYTAQMMSLLRPNQPRYEPLRSEAIADAALECLAEQRGRYMLE